MYYSKNQSNFFKAYDNKKDFLNRFNELLDSLERKKIEKIIEDVKTSNKTFKKYLN